MGKKITVASLVILLIAGTVAVATAGTMTFAGLTPANGAAIEGSDFKISAYIKDSTDNLITSTISAKIDGQIVNHSFTYKGYWAIDSCSGEKYWVNQSLKEGTVEFNAVKLTHGPHTVEVRISDKNGNQSFVSWTINVKTKAETSGFSEQTPANGTLTSTGTPAIGLTVAVTEGIVNQDNLQMKVGGESVVPVISPGNLTGTYKINYTPSKPLNDGNQSIVVTVDNPALGLNNTSTWSFNVDRTPKLISLTPQDGATIATTGPKITAGIKDTYDNLDNNTARLKTDGVAVNPVFTYKGRWMTDSCTGTSYYIIDSYKEGTLEYQASNLKDGAHTAEISISDVKGNVLTRQWSFNVGSRPVFSDFTPLNGSETGSVSKVSVRVTDDTEINPASVVMKINNSNVNTVYDPATGIINYNFNFATGKYTVVVSAADKSGNIGTAIWTFTVSSTAPVLKIVTGPDGKTITNGYLKFSAELTDVVDITSDTVLALDGKPIPAQIGYEGWTDTCTGNYYVTSKKKVYIYYDNTVPDGLHTLTLSWGNVFGSTDSRTWTINCETKPLISNWQPKNFISDTKPIISVNVKDVNTGIDPATTVMKLNGQDVAFKYDEATGNMTFKPSENLANETYHTLSVSAKDLGGLSSTLTWTFYINTYPEMADSNSENCSACHSTYPDSTIPFQSLHKNVYFYGSHSDNRCDDCHRYITYPADCLQCHGDEDGSGGWTNEAPHGSTPSIRYNLQNYDSTKAFRVIENREMWDCVICHQPNSPVLGWHWGLVKPTRVLKNHDLPELHKTSSSSCNDCHALSLTREHAREGRVDKDGKQITCNTCHKSTDTTVKAAIIAKNKNCSACHGFADHESVHVGDLDTNCQTCHVSALTQEHMNNPKTNPDKNYNCETCHTNSADKKVKRTVAANNLNCAGCHSEGHNLLFIDKVPSDIPLYSGFDWTTPIEASIFTGDSTAPAEYQNGQVVISNRKNDVTAGSVWNYYNEQLVAKGWVLKSGTPQSDATNVSAEFEKQGRYVTVKIYNTEISNGTGSKATGFRIEIWYK